MPTGNNPNNPPPKPNLGQAGPTPAGGAGRAKIPDGGNNKPPESK